VSSRRFLPAVLPKIAWLRHRFSGSLAGRK
jgi:hypothetical protein